MLIGISQQLLIILKTIEKKRLASGMERVRQPL
jgi:hypothetical protein